MSHLIAVSCSCNCSLKIHTLRLLWIGRSAVIRLLHVIQHCPTLATQAFHLAVQRIQRTRDPTLYQAAVSHYNALPGVTEQASVDQKWMDEVQVKNQSERNKLEVELKTYQSNMIKESIRVRNPPQRNQALLKIFRWPTGTWETSIVLLATMPGH